MERISRHIAHTALGIVRTVLLLMPVALVCGCSQAEDNPIDPATNQYSITFSTSESAVQVARAGSVTGLEDLGFTEITVYGYKTLNGAIQNVMPGYTLKYVANSANSTTTNSSDWEYVGQGTDYLGKAQEVKYWDGNSTDYRFFAVLPSLKDKLRYEGNPITASTVISTTGSFSMEFTGLEYMTHTKDGKYYGSDGAEVAEKDIPMYSTLWQGDPAAYYKTPVPLSFVKPYALVRLVFERPDGTSTTTLGKTGDTSHYTTFGPKDNSSMAGSGTVDVSWGMTGSRETATATAGTVTLPTMTADPMVLTNQNTRYQAWPEYMMIPTDNTVDFQCKTYIYKVNSSGTDTFDERTAIVPAAYMQWKPGYQYTYVFKITQNNSLEFSHVVAVYTKWQAGYVDNTTW